MTNQEIYEYLIVTLETELKYRDWVEFATELEFDPSFEAYESFCVFVEETV
jgi:hypothetical protein